MGKQGAEVCLKESTIQAELAAGPAVPLTLAESNINRIRF